MLVSRRRTDIVELDAYTSRVAFLTSQFQVTLHDRRRRASDERLFPRARLPWTALRSQVSIVLSGRARVTDGESHRWLEPGDVICLPERSVVLSRNEGLGGLVQVAGRTGRDAPHAQDRERFRCLDIDWVPGSLGPSLPSFERFRADARVVARLEDEVAALHEIARSCGSSRDSSLHDSSSRGALVMESEGMAAARAAGPIFRVLQQLRAVGLAFEVPEPGALIEPVLPAMRRVSLAIDAALEEPGGTMSIDLETHLGLSSRQVRRRVGAFSAHYHVGHENWLAMRSFARLATAVASMSTPGATTEFIARRFGYSSPAAFCQSLSLAGLPSPGHIARRLDELR